MKREISLVVTDLDNTLYDWVSMWYHSFDAMVRRLETQSGISRQVLESDIQAVYRRHATTEYAFLIEELPSLRALHPSGDLTQIYTQAIRSYRFARHAALKLYDGVYQTLAQLRQAGCLIVAFTESMEFYTMTRIKKLALDGILDYVYSPPDHSKPLIVDRMLPDIEYQLSKTIHRNIPKGEKKPNPEILLGIIRDDGIDAPYEKTIYVGDSLMKDVKMAQDAGLLDVYAKYGVATNSDAYEALRRVTHWTQDDVERERRILATHEIVPTYTLKNSFGELLELFDFSSHRSTRIGR